MNISHNAFCVQQLEINMNHADMGSFFHFANDLLTPRDEC